MPLHERIPDAPIIVEIEQFLWMVSGRRWLLQGALLIPLLARFCVTLQSATVDKLTSPQAKLAIRGAELPKPKRTEQ